MSNQPQVRIKMPIPVTEIADKCLEAGLDPSTEHKWDYKYIYKDGREIALIITDIGEG